MRISSLKTSKDVSGKRMVGGKQRVTFKEVVPTYSPIVDFKFVEKTGQLHFIKADGQVLTADGLLTTESLGRGRKGKRGAKGKNGKDGRDGRKGKPGDKGCTGKKGEKGDKGKRGKDGEDGPDGNPGRQGCPGIPGEEGDKGEKGDKGHQGEIGLKGIGCIVGKVGPYGPDGDGNCVIQKTAPKLAYIWGDISDYPDAVPPVEGELDFNTNSVDLNMLPVGNSAYQATAALTVSNVQNAGKSYSVNWSGDFQLDPRIKATKSLDHSTLTLEVRDILEPGQSAEITGLVNAQVIGQNEKVKSISVPYSFKGANNLQPPEEFYGVLSEDQTITEGNSATFEVKVTDSNGVVKPVDQDLAITFSFGGALQYINPSNEISRIIREGESSATVTLKTLDVGETIRSAVVQVRGLRPILNSLTANLNITPAGSTAARNLVVPSAVTITEAGNNRIAHTSVKVQLDKPFTGKEQGSIRVKLSSGTARVGVLSNGSQESLVSIESLNQLLTFDAQDSSREFLIRHIDDSFKNGTRTFNIEFSDGININVPPKINASIKDDESSGSGGGSGGGGGCIARSSMIDTPKGKIEARYLTSGDEVVSKEGLDVDPELSDSTTTVARIEQVQLDTYYKYLVIHDLALTHDHPVLVKTDQGVKWVRADQLHASDLIYKNKAWVVVGEIIERFETFETINFNVEPHDVYFANGILVHNAELSSAGLQKKV
tara:strand:- start:277 stop:2418 length:2142 start_codon:yes stop_codon:yes gene_type:complete